MGKAKIIFWTWVVCLGTTLSVMGQGADPVSYVIAALVTLPIAMALSTIVTMVIDAVIEEVNRI